MGPRAYCPACIETFLVVVEGVVSGPTYDLSRVAAAVEDSARLDRLEILARGGRRWRLRLLRASPDVVLRTDDYDQGESQRTARAAIDAYVESLVVKGKV
jgi:hypothetical protein